jgi:RNA polymerase primary sigma factor
MEPLENIRLSLDDIGDALKRLSSGSNEESQSLEEFHRKVAAFFPQIHYESNDALWADDEEEREEPFIPLWWDDLDEPFELEELHWLTRIQKYELLKPEEVRRVMEAIEAGVFAQAALDGQLEGFDKSRYEREKLERVVNLGEAAFDHMLIHNLKLAHHLARRYSRKIALEDAFSYAVIGLMQAIRKFDWRLGNQFSTYATWWIRQSLSREIADNEHTIGVPVHTIDRVNAYQREMRNFMQNEFTTAGDVVSKDRFGKVISTKQSLPQLIVEVDMDNTLTCALEAGAESLEFWDVFHQAPWLLAKYETPDNSVSFLEYSAIAKDLSERLTAYVLSEREVEVVHKRYGYGSSEPMTLEEIGNSYGLTRERVRQIEVKAMKKINEYLDGVNLENYWDVIERTTNDYRIALENTPAAIAANKKKIKAEQQAQKYYLRKQSSRRKSEAVDEREPRNLDNFVNANIERTKQAAEIQVIQVKWALEILKDSEVPTRSLLIAQSRLDNPELSLGELARLFDDDEITKDVVSGAIRRLINKAAAISNDKPPEI